MNGFMADTGYERLKIFQNRIKENSGEVIVSFLSKEEVNAIYKKAKIKNKIRKNHDMEGIEMNDITIIGYNNKDRLVFFKNKTSNDILYRKMFSELQNGTAKIFIRYNKQKYYIGR